jgi:hypothetical protein
VNALGHSGTSHAYSTVLGLIILILTQVAITEQATVVFLGIRDECSIGWAENVRKLRWAVEVYYGRILLSYAWKLKDLIHFFLSV